MEKGISNSDVRQGNRRKIMKLLYWSNGLSKQDISIRMHLSMPTVNLLVAQLDEEGLIERRRAETSSGGRIPDLIYLKYDAKLAVGLEISLESCTIIITDLAGEKKACKKVKARFNNGVTYWRGVNALILQLIKECGLCRDDVIGIGVALQESISDNGKDINDKFLFNDRNSNLGKLDALLGFPTLIERATNAAGFVNVHLGVGFKQAVYLSISEDIYGVTIVDKKVIRGENGCSGIFGHVTIDENGPRCSCGRMGCAKLYCSTSILSKAVNGSIDQFFSLLPQSIALYKAWDSYSNKLAALISNISIMMDLPIIIGGELGKYFDQFEIELEQRIEAANPFYNTKVIYAPAIREDAAARGVALMQAIRYLNIMGEN